MSLFGRSYSTEEVVDSVKQVFPNRIGDRLLSLIHFGNHLDKSLAATPDDKIQLLIVPKSIDEPTLNVIGDAYRSVTGVNQVAPMLMTEAEIASSTDVFPTTFLEMQNYYEVLFGEDVLKDLKIEPTFLRIRCEQELKNLLLRLQANFLTHHHQSRELKNVFHHCHKSFIRTLHSVQVLFDKPFGQSRDEVIRGSSENLDLDWELFKRVSQADMQNETHNLDTIRSYVSSLIELIAAAASGVDRIPNQAELLEVTNE